MLYPWLEDRDYMRLLKARWTPQVVASMPRPRKPCDIPWCAALDDGRGGRVSLARVYRPWAENVAEVAQYVEPHRCVVHRHASCYKPSRARIKPVGWPIATLVRRNARERRQAAA
jgi:hypothetical protein